MGISRKTKKNEKLASRVFILFFFLSLRIAIKEMFSVLGKSRNGGDGDGDDDCDMGVRIFPATWVPLNS